MQEPARQEEADRIVMDVMAVRQFDLPGTMCHIPIYRTDNPDSVPLPVRGTVAGPSDNEGIDVVAIRTRLVEILKERLPDYVVEYRETPFPGIYISWS